MTVRNLYHPIVLFFTEGRENITKNALDFKEIERRFSDVIDGGQWAPATCSVPKRIAIIIPYRDRMNHLKILLINLIPKLQRQLVSFKIYVIEQVNISKL